MNRRKLLFQLIDFDRTLFDTARFAKALINEVSRIRPGLDDELGSRLQTAYASEEDFNLLRYLRTLLGDVEFEKIVTVIVQREGGDGFLLPGAQARLLHANELSDSTPAWGILTYGDVLDQHMKLRIAGLESVPVYISDTPDKGDLIAKWQLADGRFRLPDALTSITVDALSLEDDKLRAFRNLPEGVSAFWITQYDDAPSRLAEVEWGRAVTPVKSVVDSLHILQQKYL